MPVIHGSDAVVTITTERSFVSFESAVMYSSSTTSTNGRNGLKSMPWRPKTRRGAILRVRRGPPTRAALDAASQSKRCIYALSRLQGKVLDIGPGSALGWRSRSQGSKALEIHSFGSSSES